jgi:hypothetical protein
MPNGCVGVATSPVIGLSRARWGYRGLYSIEFAIGVIRSVSLNAYAIDRLPVGYHSRYLNTWSERSAEYWEAE